MNNSVSFTHNNDFSKSISAASVTPSEESGVKIVRRSKTIPMSCVVFLQTFIVALLVVSAPLFVSLKSMYDSNNLSVNSGKQVASTLATQIQKDQSNIVQMQINTLLSKNEFLTNDFSRVVNLNKLQITDLDILYQYFWRMQVDSGPLPFVYVGFSNGNFIGIRADINADGTASYMLQIRLAVRPATCTICPSAAIMIDTNTRYHFSIDQNGVPSTSLNSSKLYDTVSRPWFVQGVTTPNLEWTKPYPFSTKGDVGFTAVKGFNNPIDTVFALDIRFQTLSQQIQNFQKTTNAFIYSMTSDGEVVGATYSGSLVDTDGKTLRKPNSVDDPNIKKSGEHLLTTLNGNPDWSSLGDFRTFTLDDIFFQYSVLKSKNLNFVVVNGAPKTDYVGDIDNVQKLLSDTLRNNFLIIIGVAVSVFIVIVTISLFIINIFVINPLKEISLIMDQATRFDFSALKDRDAINKRSIVKEFESLQSSFFIMIKNFAQSLKNNKALQTRKTNGTNSLSYTQQNTSVNEKKDEMKMVNSRYG
ncbi:hypothetical protein HDU92_001069, partial [Lobulomyces angularis]